MQVEFSSKFSKDIDGISQKSIKLNLIKLIQLFESSQNLNVFLISKNWLVISLLTALG